MSIKLDDDVLSLIRLPKGTYNTDQNKTMKCLRNAIKFLVDVDFKKCKIYSITHLMTIHVPSVYIIMDDTEMTNTLTGDMVDAEKGVIIYVPVEYPLVKFNKSVLVYKFFDV